MILIIAQVGIKALINLMQTSSVDCVMGDWTKWSSCSKSCNDYGFQKRSREIIHAQQNGGRPCPSEPEEKSDCNKDPCPGTKV